MTRYPHDVGEGEYFLALYHTKDHVLSVNWYSSAADADSEWSGHEQNKRADCCFHERLTAEQVDAHRLAQRLEGE